MLALGDALAMVLLEARGFDKDDFARFHPGGRLGRALLLKVRQVMRPREEMALVTPERTVGEVLGEIARHRAGAAVVVDGDGTAGGHFHARRFRPAFPARPGGSGRAARAAST